jgi:hypothetical protein
MRYASTVYYMASGQTLDTDAGSYTLKCRLKFRHNALGGAWIKAELPDYSQRYNVSLLPGQGMDQAIELIMPLCCDLGWAVRTGDDPALDMEDACDD